MTHVSLDFETYSESPLRQTGSWVYANHPSTEVLCCAYAYGDDDPKLWRPGDPLPDFVANPAGYTLHAYNAQFEWQMWRYVLADTWGTPPPFEQWRCTATQTAALALPRKLGDACRAVGLPADQQKDSRGTYLIQRVCQPYRGKRIHDAALLQELYFYCEQDVVAERALSRRLLPLSAAEQAVWCCDQRINERGIPIDVEDVAAALDLLKQAQQRITARGEHLAPGINIGSTLQFQDYVKQRFGIELENCQKAYLEQVRDEVKAPELRELITLRLNAAKAAVKKYEKLAQLAAVDGRAHGTLMYHGAQPGRWAGRHVNPQNFMRPAFDDTDACADLLQLRDLASIEALYGEPMTALSSVVRSVIAAKPGHKIIDADYSAIESRGLAWQAGQQDKLDVYRAKDAGEIPYGVYRQQASGIFGVPAEDISKGDWRRQIGKVADLALGYQGGWRAFVAMAGAYGLDMDAIVENATPEQRAEFPDIKLWWFKYETPEEDYKDLDEFEVYRLAQTHMTDGEAFADLIKKRWRVANAKIVEYWGLLLEAAIGATNNPDKVYTVNGKIRFRYFKKAGFLLCYLPSGRPIAYSNPQPAIDEKTERDILKFTGTDDKGRWRRQVTWGGKLAQNITEGICRDLLAVSHIKLERAGYPVFLHVHDQNASEVPVDFGSHQDYESIMEQTPQWAAGLPVKAEGFEARRWRK